MISKFRQKIKENEKTIEIIASILAVLMFFSLIEILISNIQGKSNIFIQPIATAVNGAFWSLYAFSKKDWLLFTPNFLALILGILTAISVIF
ncbi:hypothetical protein JXA48_02420 [Candidatus Woesearchaeota archaeon]|nr:hypothetical protein [Candidatus Woesearchaeota archaeon]